jgi:hypothetical protein
VTVSPSLQKLIDALPEPERLTFFALAETIYRVRYTGYTGIQWLNGIPKQLDLGSPVKLSIVEGISPALDSGARNRSG